MTKFTLNLRKSFAVTRFSRIDSESENLGPLVYPPASLGDARHQDSSDTLPPIKSKQGFSLNKCHNGFGKKSGLLARRTKSSPGLRNPSPESKETPKFVTLFLRRSTPSWWNSKRELRVVSEASAHSPVLEPEATSSRYPREARVPVDPTPNCSPRSGSESPKSSDEVGGWSKLPIPPIIISSPTLPDALCFPEESNGGTRKLIRRADSEQEKPSGIEELEESTNFSLVMLQSAARQIANDPSATQTNIFRLSAPITAFLYALGIGVTALKKEEVIFEPGTNVSQITVYAFVIPLGMLLVLALLRGILWVMSKLGRSFCELDLEEVFARGIFIDSEGERLTEADFIVGNLIT